MARQLIVLGSQAAHPTQHQPCSGFLLTWDDFSVVLDLGYGTLERLFSLRPSGSVDAIIITHEHPDHWLDLHGLFRFYYYGAPDGNGRPVRRPSLYCPKNVTQKMINLEPDADLQDAFDVYVLDNGSVHDVGPFTLTGILLPHHVPNIGIRLDVLAESPNGSRTVLAYTGDTGPTPRLEDIARNSELFICEATDRPGELNKKLEDRRLMYSVDAGYWAARSGAKRLLLTHFWPGNDRQLAVKKAEAQFKGQILAAEPGTMIELL